MRLHTDTAARHHRTEFLHSFIDRDRRDFDRNLESFSYRSESSSERSSLSNASNRNLIDFETIKAFPMRSKPCRRTHRASLEPENAGAPKPPHDTPHNCCIKITSTIFELDSLFITKAATIRSKSQTFRSPLRFTNAIPFVTNRKPRKNFVVFFKTEVLRIIY